GRVVCQLDQRVTLHLGLGFQPPVGPRTLAGDLDALVPGFALRPALLFRKRIRLTQLVLATRMHNANAEPAARRPPPAVGCFAVECAESVVVELARRRVEVA